MQALTAEKGDGAGIVLSGRTVPGETKPKCGVIVPTPSTTAQQKQMFYDLIIAIPTLLQCHFSSVPLFSSHVFLPTTNCPAVFKCFKMPDRNVKLTVSQLFPLGIPVHMHSIIAHSLYVISEQKAFHLSCMNFRKYFL